MMRSVNATWKCDLMQIESSDSSRSPIQTTPTWNILIAATWKYDLMQLETYCCNLKFDCMRFETPRCNLKLRFDATWKQLAATWNMIVCYFKQIAATWKYDLMQLETTRCDLKYDFVRLETPHCNLKTANWCSRDDSLRLEVWVGVESTYVYIYINQCAQIVR